jgi:hypothetical protein
LTVPSPPAEHQSKVNVGTFQLHSERGGYSIIVYAPDRVTGRAVMRETEYLVDDFTRTWFGLEPSPEPGKDPAYEVTIFLRLGNERNGLATKFQRDKFRGAHLTLTGSLDEILCDVLPAQVAQTVLAANLGNDIPLWVRQGLPGTAVSTDRQIELDARVRKGLNAGTAVKLKHLFQRSGGPQSNASDVEMATAQSTSVVRFLLRSTPKGGIPVLSDVPYIDRLFPNHGTKSQGFFRFVKIGGKDGWDTAAQTVYGFESVDRLEDRWIQWLNTEASKTERSGQPFRADPSRIPPVNLRR